MRIAPDAACDGKPAVRRQANVAEQDVDLLPGQHLEQAERLLRFEHLVGAKPAQNAVGDAARIGIWIGDENDQIAQVDGWILHVPAWANPSA